MVCTTKRKVYWQERKVIVREPHCPRCNLVIRQVTNIHEKTIMTFRCDNCGYME
jgi:transposase-like protein